jgi:hypothetical protein
MTYFALSPLVLLILIFVIGASVGLATRRARRIRANHFHWVARVFFALLAAAAVITVGVGTWRGTNPTSATQAVIVMVPTTSPPEMPKNRDSNGRVDIGPCKVIGTVLLVRIQQGRAIPICGESLTLDVPSPDYPELVFHGKLADSEYTVRMRLDRFVRFGGDDQLSPGSGASVEARGARWSRSGGTALNFDRLEVQSFGGFGDTIQHAPLSVIPTVDQGDLRLFLYLTRADQADPLRKVSASEWLADKSEELWANDEHSRSIDMSHINRETPPGIRMLMYLGPSVVLLLLAAVAGSGLFPRGWRAIGFTGLLACMVLYAGLLDGLILHRRARIVADANQPEEVRASALENLQGGTFFHTGRAAKIQKTGGN